MAQSVMRTKCRPFFLKYPLDKMCVCVYDRGMIYSAATKGRLQMLVNFYYSIRVLESIGYKEDDDSLLTLCRACADKHAGDVKWAQRGNDDSECEFCDATNNPARTAELDRIFAQVRHG